MQVFGKQWFKVHQTKLLKLFNSAIGREMLYLGLPRGKKCVAVFPNSIAYVEGWDLARKQARVVHKLWAYPAVVVVLEKRLRWIWKAMHAIDGMWLDHQQLITDFGFGTYTETFRRGLDGETGYIDADTPKRSGGGETWGVLRAGLGTTTTGELAQRSGPTLIVDQVTNNAYSSLARYAATFDTSPIGNIARSVDTSAVKVIGNGGHRRHYPAYSPVWTGNDSGVSLVHPNIADTGAGGIASSDYERFTTTRLADDILEASFNLGAAGTVTNIWTWYPSAVSTYLNIDGVTQLGLIATGDTDNITPTWSNDTYDLVWALLIPMFDLNTSPAVSSYMTVEYDLPLKINIGDVWKEIDTIWINVGDDWKNVTEIKINISDVWKDVN